MGEARQVQTKPWTNPKGSQPSELTDDKCEQTSHCKEQWCTLKRQGAKAMSESEETQSKGKQGSENTRWMVCPEDFKSLRHSQESQKDQVTDSKMGIKRAEQSREDQNQEMEKKAEEEKSGEEPGQAATLRRYWDLHASTKETRSLAAPAGYAFCSTTHDYPCQLSMKKAGDGGRLGALLRIYPSRKIHKAPKTVLPS